MHSILSRTQSSFPLFKSTMLFPAVSSLLVGLAILQDVAGAPGPIRGAGNTARSTSDVISIAGTWKENKDIVPSICGTILSERNPNSNVIEKRFFGVVR